MYLMYQINIRKVCFSFFQLLGQNSSSEFSASVSPGTIHVVSYVAIDNENMNWTCAFKINAESKDMFFVIIILKTKYK